MPFCLIKRLSLMAEILPMNRVPLLETNGFNQLVKGRDGYYLYNINDIYIGQAIERYGEYGGLEAQFLEQLCAVGDVIIEVGANMGAHTVTLAKRVGPTGAVIAFEPQRIVFQNLCANIALNSLSNVECHCAAVAATRSSLLVPELDFRQRNNFGGISLVNAPQGRRVLTVPLDEFVGLPRLKLIKIDVEGMEADVIKGAKQLIAKFKPLLYVENDRVDQSENLMRLIDSLGYSMYWHTPPLFNPNNFFAEQENMYANIVSINMFCVHQDTHANVEGALKVSDFASHPMRRLNMT
jgi:FkbM family methyltransferase